MRFNRKIRVSQALLIAAVTTCPILSSTAVGAAELSSDWEDRIKAGVRAYDRGEDKNAFDTFYRLMGDAGREFGGADGRMVRFYTNLGEAYSTQEQYDYAENCFKKGLNLAKAGFGANSIQSVPALIDLAQMYVKLGRDSQALPLFKQALSIVDKPNDEKLQPYVAVVEADLGAMYFAQGNYAFAEPHFKRSLEVATEYIGPAHKWTTTIGGMYATCVRAQGRKAEAKAIERAAIAKANEVTSPISIWNKQITLADAAIAEKRYGDAEQALKQAWQAAQDLPSEPMLQALILTRQGDSLLAQDKKVDAIEKLKAAQKIADSAMGLEDKAVLARAKQLALLERGNGQFVDAEPLFIRLVADAKKRFGPESDQYATALQDLAELYKDAAQGTKAVTAYGALLEWQEAKLGKESEKLIPTLVALGSVSQNTTRYLAEVSNTAELHYKRAAELATKHFGKNSKETADVLDALSRYYQRHFDWEKAVKTCTVVVATNEKTFGPNSDQTMKALEHYAIVLRAAGLRNQAEPVEARINKMKGTPAKRDPISELTNSK